MVHSFMKYSTIDIKIERLRLKGKCLGQILFSVVSKTSLLIRGL